VLVELKLELVATDLLVETVGRAAWQALVRVPDPQINHQDLTAETKSIIYKRMEGFGVTST
jgi:hypothetical protein